VRGATVLGDWNENRRRSSSEHHSAREHRDIDCAGLRSNARKGRREESRVGAADAEQKRKAAEAEKAYKAALDKIPDKKKSDPWGSVR
jgi:hypothetical protein